MKKEKKGESVGFTNQERVNGFYQLKDDVVNTLEQDRGIKLLLTVPAEQLRDFFLQDARVQKHLERVSFRVDNAKMKNFWFINIETIK